MKATPEVEAAVLATLRSSWGAYQARDVEGVLSHYTTDGDLVAIGTGTDERFIGPDSLREGLIRDFSQGQEASLKIMGASVSMAGNVAWVAADCVAEVMMRCRTVSVAGRLTAVLELRGDLWYIMQTHFSLPAGGQGAAGGQVCAQNR